MDSEGKTEVIGRCARIIRRQHVIIQRMGEILVLLTADGRHPALRDEAVRVARAVIELSSDISDTMRLVEEAVGAAPAQQVDTGGWVAEPEGPTLEV